MREGNFKRFFCWKGPCLSDLKVGPLFTSNLYRDPKKYNFAGDMRQPNIVPAVRGGYPDVRFPQPGKGEKRAAKELMNECGVHNFSQVEKDAEEEQFRDLLILMELLTNLLSKDFIDLAPQGERIGKDSAAEIETGKRMLPSFIFKFPHIQVQLNMCHQYIISTPCPSTEFGIIHVLENLFCFGH